jgi:hypothetical protein
MLSHFRFAALLAVLLALPAGAQTTPYPRSGFRAQLTTVAHNVQGTVSVVDADTLLVEHFSYDGGGLSVYFYLGAQNTPGAFSAGLQIGPQLLGSVFQNASFSLDLPAGATLDGYNAISVWCVAANTSFGHGAFAALPPARYCSAKLNSQGCTPQISFVGSPSAASATAFTIDASKVINNKLGLLLYGRRRIDTPFSGGLLCVAAAVRRSPAQNSAGNPGGDDCSGSYSLDFNALIQSGLNPALTPGALVCAQYWQRDPNSSFGVGLSDALGFYIAP